MIDIRNIKQPLSRIEFTIADTLGCLIYAGQHDVLGTHVGDDKATRLIKREYGKNATVVSVAHMTAVIPVDLEKTWIETGKEVEPNE